MGNVILAINAASTLLDFIVNAAQALAQINTTIAAAQAAGTDISDAQLQQVIAQRDAAVAQLMQTLGLAPPPPPPPPAGGAP